MPRISHSDWVAPLTRTLGGIGLCIGLTVLAGWALGVDPLVRSLAGNARMAPATAAAIAMAGLALLAGAAATRPGSDARRRQERMVRGLGAAIGAIGLVKLVEYAGGWSFGLDVYGMRDPASGPDAVRVSQATALSLALLGGAFLLSMTRRWALAFQALTLSGLLLAWFGISFHIYGGEPLIGFTAMAVRTAAALLVLNIGVLTMRTDCGLMSMLVSDNEGGLIARTLVPAVLVFPLVSGWMELQGLRAGWFGAEAGTSLFAVAHVLFFGALIWRTAALAERIAITDRIARELESTNRQLHRRNAEVERSDRMKSEFLATMSHELRSPLHTIIGFAEVLLEEIEGPLNEKQKRFTGNIYQDSHHLLALINDLLDISKIEAGRMELHLERIGLDGMLQELAEMTGPQAESRGLLLTMEAQPDTHVEAAPRRLRQILTNLLSNALKFTPRGGTVRVTVLARATKVAIRVRDSGVGIEGGDHEAIFDKFYQTGTTTKGVREGTGLGLAISKRLVEQQGGRIWVNSRPGRGSTFIFTVRNADPARIPLRPLVVVLEGIPEVTERLAAYFEREGFHVLQAENAGQLLTIAAELNPDVLVMDLTAAKSGEWRQMQELRDDGRIAGVPLVVLSAGRAGEAAIPLPIGNSDLVDALTLIFAKGPARWPVLLEEASPGVRAALKARGFEAVVIRGNEAAGTGFAPAAAIVELAGDGAGAVALAGRLRARPGASAPPVFVVTGKEVEKGGAEASDGRLADVLRKIAVPTGATSSA